MQNEKLYVMKESFEGISLTEEAQQLSRQYLINCISMAKAPLKKLFSDFVDKAILSIQVAIQQKYSQ